MSIFSTPEGAFWGVSIQPQWQKKYAHLYQYKDELNICLLSSFRNLPLALDLLHDNLCVMNTAEISNKAETKSFLVLYYTCQNTRAQKGIKSIALMYSEGCVQLHNQVLTAITFYRWTVCFISLETEMILPLFVSISLTSTEAVNCLLKIRMLCNEGKTFGSLIFKQMY